jgi:hypothetical protein
MKPQYILINEYGNKYYHSDKEMKVMHREDGPAAEWGDGTKIWYNNNKLHREDGPAVIISTGTKKWLLNGKFHREDGPAIECADGSKTWYINDVMMTEAEFKSRTAPCNGKKVTVDGIEYTLTVK